MSAGISVGLPVPSPPSQAAVTLTPRILWPSLERAGGAQPASWQPTDLGTFPDAPFITERRRRGDGKSHLPMFREQVRRAFDRVLIVDTYLLCGGEAAEDEILSWFPNDFEANDVRIGCGGMRPGREERLFRARLTDCTAAINARRTGTGGQAAAIQLKLTLDPGRYPFVHDRFAVVDDELWHFGATVGGLHHGVNAATRGWSATAVGAVRFFGEVWRQPAQGGSGVRTACDRGAR